MREFIIAATGHRPNKLGGYTKAVSDRLQTLARNVIERESPDIVMSGMALGWDQAWVEAAIDLGVPFIAAVPFNNQSDKWPRPSRKRYHQLLDKAKLVYVVSQGGYAPEKLQIRNEYMVDASHKMAALWDGSQGGTFNCIRYAVKRGKPIIQLWDEWKALK